MEFFRPSRRESPMPPRMALLGHGQDRAGMTGDAGNQIVHGGFQLSFRNKAVDEPEFQCAFRGDGFAQEARVRVQLWGRQETAESWRPAEGKRRW